MAQEARACLLTGGFLVQTPALSVSAPVSLGKTLHPSCLLVVVRGSGGASMCSLASVSVP